MDSGTISQLVFVIFGAAVLLYGFILYRSLARLRDTTDHAQARLNALLRDLRDEEAKVPETVTDSTEMQTRIAELPQNISTEVESFNQAVRQYNARIGQFPDAIVAAIMGMQRRPLFRMSETAENEDRP